MAKKRKGPNKSAEIRAYYDANPSAMPKEVAEALKAKGVDVTAQFVSTIRSKQMSSEGAPKKRPGRPKGSVKKTAAKKTVAKTPGTRRGRPPKAPNVGGSQLSVESLLRVKEVADEMGGVANVRASLDALDQLSS